MKAFTFSRVAWLVCALTLLCTIPLLWACPALAAGTNAGTSTSFENTPVDLSKPSSPTGISAGGSIIRSLLALAVVLGIIYGLYWLMKQARASKDPATGYGLEQVAHLPLGPNRSVALVRVGAELHLLGVSEHGITGIRIYSEEEAYELGLPFDGPDDGAPMYGRGAPPLQRLVDTFKRFTMR